MMMQRQTMRHILDKKIIAIIRADSPEKAVESALAVIDAGLDIVEISLTTPQAARVIRDVRVARPNAMLGAGTVRMLADVEAVETLKVRFIVMPCIDAKIIAAAKAHDWVTVPGVASAHEVHEALNAGADLLKLFPATTYGAAHMRALMQPFPKARFVPTGGVDATNAADWLSAGAVALGVGGALTKGTLEERKAEAKRLLEAVASVAHVAQSEPQQL